MNSFFLMFLALTSFCCDAFSPVRSFDGSPVGVRSVSGLQKNQKSMVTTCHVYPITSEVEGFLEDNYPTFRSLIRDNEKIWNATREAEDGYTIFAPNEEAIASLLDSDKVKRLKEETDLSHIFASYHFINELVTEEELNAAGGVVTLGGLLPVGHSTSGNFLGLGGKNKESSVTINDANLLQSFEISNCIIHEVDAFVCPESILQHLAVISDLTNNNQNDTENNDKQE